MNKQNILLYRAIIVLRKTSFLLLSCDSFHAKISQQINKNKVIHTPEHCLQLIQNSRKKFFTKEVIFSDVILFSDLTYKTKNKTPFHIKNVIIIKKHSITLYL